MEKYPGGAHSVSFAADTVAGSEPTTTSPPPPASPSSSSVAGVVSDVRRDQKSSLASQTSSGQRRVLSFSIDSGGGKEIVGGGQRAGSIGTVPGMCESGEYPDPGATSLATMIAGGDIGETNGQERTRSDSQTGVAGESGFIIGGTSSTTTPKRGRRGRQGPPGGMRGSPSRRAMMVESIRRFSVNPASFMAERRKSRSHSLASFKLSYYPQDNRKLDFSLFELGLQQNLESVQFFFFFLRVHISLGLDPGRH